MHGGKRPGAGRPRVDPLARQQAVMDTLIIPAFKACELGKIDIPLAVRDISHAHGTQGLALWKEWFEVVSMNPAMGVDNGGLPTVWRLKLKHTIAAQKILSTATGPLLFPSQALQVVMHKKQHEAWVRGYLKACKEFGVQNPRPKEYVPLTFGEPGPTPEQILTAQRGWEELLGGENQGFSDEYTGFVPDEAEVPY